MRRRYKRTNILWKPVLGLILVVNTAVAGFNSRITSIRSIEVVGLQPEDNDRIKKILTPLQGIPFSKVKEKQIETEVLREGSIKTVSFTHNMWGGARLGVRYRKPVARLAQNPRLGLDAEGVVFDSPAISSSLPSLTPPNNGPATLLTLAGDWDAKRIAELAVKIRTVTPPSGVSIEVDERGEVCLNMNSGRVVLGSCDDLDTKLGVLQKRLLANPAELSQVKRLILTKPDVPAIEPLPLKSDHRKPKTP